MKRIVAFVIFVTLLGMIGYSIYQAIGNKDELPLKTGVTVGNKAPDFELQLVGGETVKLSELEGKKVLLNFWASWCEPCLKEMPEMQELYDTASDDIVILAVNMTVTEKNLDTAKNFINDQGFTFPVLLDVTNKTSSNYEVLTLPTSFFIDTNGVIRERFPGPMDLDYMKQALNRLD